MILEIQTWPTLSIFLVLLGGAVGMVVGAFAPHISRAVYGKLTLASVAVPGLVIIIVSGLLGWVNFYLGNLGAPLLYLSLALLGFAGGYVLVGTVAIVHEIATLYLANLLLERTDSVLRKLAEKQ